MWDRVRKHGSSVVIQDVLPHGADLLFVRGTVDGVPTKTYVPRASLADVRPENRRARLAGHLRDAKPVTEDLSALVGREEHIW